MPRIKPRIDSPLLVVSIGPFAFATSYSLDDSSRAYREGFVSGLTDSIHLDNIHVVKCTECSSDRIAGRDHEFKDGHLEVTCCSCNHIFAINEKGRDTSEVDDDGTYEE